MRSFIRPILNFLGSLYYRVLATETFWRARNRQANRKWRAHMQLLTSAEARAVASLSQTGIAVTHINDLLPASAFAELRLYAEARWRDPEVERVIRERQELFLREKPKGVRKAFLVNLWNGPATLDLDHPFVRFSLSLPILNIINAYLEMLAKFRFWHLEATIPIPPSVRATASQRWHRDPEDRKLVKTFLYLNDVDVASGPFMYLQHSHAGGKWREIFAQRPPSGSPPMPPDADRFIPSSDVLSAIGEAGTLIFCDTSGLHRGGLATKNHRLMYTSVYTSSASFTPIRYTYPSSLDTQGLSLEAQFSIRNNPNQQPPRFYRGA